MISKIKKKLPQRKDISMKESELEKLSIKELKELRLRVDSLIATRQLEERSGLREKFRAMAEAVGLTLADVVGGKAGKGGKVAAKFANPSNPQDTWSGRGRQPRWLAAKLKDGGKLDDFRL